MCKCCVSEEQCKFILDTPLRQLSGEELSNYASSVFLTGGDQPDFMYFFPRILELSLEEQFFWPCPEVVYRAIVNSDWDKWKDAEQCVVRELTGNKLNSMMDAEEHVRELDAWLCAAASVFKDISPFLAKLEKAKVFESFIEWNIGVVVKRKLDSEFWQDRPAQAAQLVNWFSSDLVRNHCRKTLGMRF